MADFVSLQLSALPDAALRVHWLRGAEYVSRPFRFTLEFSASDSSLPIERIPGSAAMIKITPRDGTPRHLHGHVARVQQRGTALRETRYQVLLVPWLTLLRRTRQSRIFRPESDGDLSIVEIVKEVCKRYPMARLRSDRLKVQPSVRYCVQHQESDHDFISRLLEQHGISYYFEHSAERHTLVLADAPDAYPSCPGQSRVSYQASAEPDQQGYVSALRLRQEVAPPQVVVGDYDFEQARSVFSTPAGAQSDFESFEYPGGFTAGPDGDQLAARRYDARAIRQRVVSGLGTCMSFTAGGVFELADHVRSDANQRYLLLEVRHQFFEDGADAGARQGPYRNRFLCIPARTRLRPRPVTPRPCIRGPETAVVVGEAGREVHTDRYGRVALRFHWDRAQQVSCWARVAQSWAGKRWGTFFLPRVGQEVVVEFLNGDPEQPIVTGALYNGAETVPYPLPEKAHSSGIKSNTLGGTGCNELRFDDKKDEERIFLRAQRDLHLRTGQECREWVGKDRHLHVKGARREEIGDGFLLKVGKEFVLEAGNALTLSCAGSYIRIDAKGVTINGQKVFINCAAGAAAGTIEQPPAEAESGDEPGAANTNPVEGA